MHRTSCGLLPRIGGVQGGDAGHKRRREPAAEPVCGLARRRRRIDQALFAVVMEAYVHGGSTRKVDDLVAAMGAHTGISKTEVSRICADLDVEVAAFRDRSLTEVDYPYVFLDACFCKARVGGDRRGGGARVAAQAVVVATGVTADGRREVLGFDVGDSESGVFWTGFLHSLKARGLRGVQLVISDAHTGLKTAVSSVLLGAAWQRSSANIVPGGWSRWCTSAAGRGPWQRDLRGPAADPSLPAVVVLDRLEGASGSVALARRRARRSCWSSGKPLRSPRPVG